jgi:hypothetical protein
MPTFDFTAPDGTTHSIDGPEGATREQAFHMLQLKLGGPSAPAAPQESLASDVGKSAGGGMESGFNSVMAMPHGLSRLAHAIAPQSVIDAVKAIPGAQTAYKSLPSIDDVNAAADRAKAAGARPSIIGPSALIPDAYKDSHYEPQYAPGRYAHALTENAVPGLMMGMSPLAVGAGAVGGQLTEDVTGSKTAGAVANLASSIAAPMAAARYFRQAAQPLKDIAAVKAESNAAYADPLLRDTTIAPQAAEKVAGDMHDAMNAARSRFAPSQAPAVHEAIDNLGNTAPRTGIGPPAPISIEDLHNFRKTLGTIGQETRDFKPTEQATAAGTAKRVLDQYLDNIPGADVTRGNPIDAVQALRNANGDWRAASNAKKVENLIGNATTDNNAANSAMNLGNRIRQTFKPLLKNDAAKLRGMGYDDDVINAVSKVNKGDFLTNTLRFGSNVLGGGGGVAGTIIGHGMASATGGVLGFQEGGLPGMAAGTLAGMVPGQVLRLAANARTLKNAQAVQQQILSKAPANATIVAANSAAKAANKAAMKSAITRNGIPAAALLLQKLNGH